MTNYPVIDPHVHLWDMRRTPREASGFVKLLGFHRPTMLMLARKIFPQDAAQFFGQPDSILANHLPEDYQNDTIQPQIDGFVHIEASWKAKGPLGPLAETEWLESLNSPLLKGIVGYADLSLGVEVDNVLRAHLEASPRFRGIRFALANHPRNGVLNACGSENLTADKTWRSGYELLANHQLSFDATVYHHQLNEIVVLARDFPEVPIILCHAGTPIAYGGAYQGLGESKAAREKISQDWQDNMRRLAELPNVNVKISGLGMPILGWGYHERETTPLASEVAEDFKPMIDFIIEAFGAARCMFASNFPIDKVSMPFETLYESFKLSVADRSKEEKQLLFSGTAQRVYRIDSDSD